MNRAAHSAAVRAEMPEAAPVRETAAPITILVVEDNDLNMRLFQELLEARGYTVLQGRTGRQGLEMARRHRPDLIIMDVQLPEMSGLEATARLKTDVSLKAIPVIAVTAFAMTGDEARIRDSGCDGYLAKPISVASFLGTVERFLDTAR